MRSANFAADGSLIVETLSEYALGDYGWYYECKTTTRFPDGESFYNEYNQYGDATRTINIHADSTVWLDRVYEYEYAHGVKRRMKAYEDGVLVAEKFYDEEGCNAKDVECLKDGSYIVFTYDEDGNTIETVYDAAGNLVE